MRYFNIIYVAALATLIGLAGCSGENDDTQPPVPTYTVGGTLTGLSGNGLVLQNNSGDNLAISADGDFIFATALTDASDYTVTVQTQPSSPSQTCNISNGSGTISSADITDISIVCTTNTYSVGGSVSGLSGNGLVLQNNSGDNLSVSADGSFTFSTAIADTSAYAVTIQTQPSSPSQTCSISNSGGTISSANITNVSIVCSTNTYSVGGSVTGLTGTGLVLQNNGGDDLSVSADGSFTFSTAIADTSTYSVTLLTEPAGHQCTLSNGSGTISGSNVTSVTVTCITLASRVVYVANAGSDDVSAFRVDPATGALTEVGTAVAAGTGPTSVTVHPTGRFAYVTNAIPELRSFSIDAATGALTAVGAAISVG
ncbi:MAG: lactonase family protein, partial [Gammaproteobacteria bacterium]|nr:lactonase family protein [Gammaproteobacteria bacterium]